MVRASRRDRRPHAARIQRRRVLLTAAVAFCFLALLPCATAKRGPRISDNLDDVVDSEEDEAFLEWGRRTVVDDGLPQMTQSGAQLAFARLIPLPVGTRSIEDVNVLASQWATLLRSGGMSEQAYAVDDTTILMSIPNAKLMPEVREFLWLQPSVQSFEWNSEMWMKGETNAVARPAPRNLRKEKQDLEKARRKKERARKRRKEKKANVKADL
jgi:hypothetical protein|tara:strand:- start:866 stop:1504 length:639 start_codon:yes stop_codon:yes gene_type:complete